MKEILRLKPVFQHKLWGGDRMRQVFGYDIPDDHTGECWAISGHSGGQSVVQDGPFAGQTLGQLWQTHRELFGNLPGDCFPLLVKIIDARQDLSIQVHPDDDYARVHENGALGKTECWYVLDCEPRASIIIGHNAADRDALAQMVQQGRWTELLRQVPIHPGDFFQIEPGCLHAIRGGTLILETQQSSDVTYRFYDYDRLENGRPRTLHIEKSLAVTTAPFRPATVQPETTRTGDMQITHLVTCPYYSVYRAQLDGQAQLSWQQPFVNLSVLSGSGTLDGTPVRQGDHLLLCANYGPMHLSGHLTLLYSHP